MRAPTLQPKIAAAIAALLAVGLLATWAGTAAAARAGAAAHQAKKTESDKEKKEAEKKEAEKKDAEKKGGLFGGMKGSIGLGRSEEKTTTVATGAKAIEPVGKKMASLSPTSTDRSRVATMEAAKPGQQEMAAFLKEGNLTASRKGGS